MTHGSNPEPPAARGWDDCPTCGADLAVNRVLHRGLLLLCRTCGSSAPPAPASAWGPPLPRSGRNWPDFPRPGAIPDVRRPS